MPPGHTTTKRSTSRKRSQSRAAMNQIPGASTVYACSFNGTSQTRIQQPHAHDVLSGRGGSINSHPGNVMFREWVRARKNAYNLARNKHEKTMVAKEVMALVQNQSPPGRFLHKDPRSAGSGWWFELDEDRMLAKTAQALREGAPEIRAKLKNEPVVHRASSKKHSVLEAKPSESVSSKSLQAPRRKEESPLEEMALQQPSPDAPPRLTLPDTTFSLSPQPYRFPSIIPSEHDQTEKQVRMDYNGTVVRPNDETPPLLPMRSEPLLLPALSLPPPQANSTTSGGNGLPRSHSLALSDISVGDWMNEEFVNPFENESDDLESFRRNYQDNHGNGTKLHRDSSSSSSLSAIPKPAQTLIGPDMKATESNGDMGGIGVLMRNQRENDEVRTGGDATYEKDELSSNNGFSHRHGPMDTGVRRTISDDGSGRYNSFRHATVAPRVQCP